MYFFAMCIRNSNSITIPQYLIMKSCAALNLCTSTAPSHVAIDVRGAVVLMLDFYWQIPVSQWKPGAPRGQDREQHSGNTACLGREYTHTQHLSKHIDHQQQCDWFACSARGFADNSDDVTHTVIVSWYVRTLCNRPKRSTSEQMTVFTGLVSGFSSPHTFWCNRLYR